MNNKIVGTREYKTLPIANTVVVGSARFLSDQGGYFEETIDFTELNYFLNEKFEPRCNSVMNSPEGVGRGGYVEDRAKVLTVVSGYVYFALIDMRLGNDRGKTCEFYLGKGEDTLGTSVVVPEGLITYFVSISGKALVHQTSNRLFNKFAGLKAVDVSDPELGLHMPKDTKRHTTKNELVVILSLKDYLKTL
jgi:dTDP-4-dehydrorhamnose 3,5-epimerase-like enzyme